jgi:hypothetical protein
MEISNKTLAWLVVVAMAVSLFATGDVLIRLGEIEGVTGLVGETYNATGWTNITISTKTILRYAIAAVDYGSLAVNTTLKYCNITHNGTGNTSLNAVGCDGIPAALNEYNLVLENAGSTYLNVTLNFSQNGTTMFGGGIAYGVPPLLQFTVSNNESGSCQTLISNYTGQWANITLPMINTTTLVCQNLSYVDADDSLLIGMKLGIPIDTISGPKSLTITAQGTALN